MMSAIAAEIDAVTGRENTVDTEDSELPEECPVEHKIKSSLANQNNSISVLSLVGIRYVYTYPHITGMQSMKKLISMVYKLWYSRYLYLDMNVY